MRRRTRILIVDDNADTRQSVRAALLGMQFDLCEAMTGPDGLELFADCRPDLVMLGLDLPDLAGWDAVRRLRAISDVPILALSGTEVDADEVRVLHEGADDHVATPFNPDRLAARVGALLRRAARRPVDGSAGRIELDDGWLVVDRVAREIWVRGERQPFTATEYGLLTLLAERAGQVVSPAQMLTLVWGPEYVLDTGYVKTYIRRVRSKIEPDPQQPRFLLSRRGQGYVLVRGSAGSDPLAP